MSLHSPIRQLPLLKRLQQRLEAQSLPETEESIPLRILVQALVTIGIIATDLAAAESAYFQGISLWAVPMSCVGATWSWYRRRSRNIPVKFCIAIAMLMSLAVFFMRLWAERNDTRLALATLLIQLQVFHSFDLPRRKDLGYSIVIGLILLGVAATLSQTMAFAPLLFLFLAIALPALILDYRSRLGLTSGGLKQLSATLSPKRLVIFLGVTLSLGLTIFLLLPRLPGYQISTFPVSAPIELQDEFESDLIINPGYGQEGSLEGDGTGSGAGTQGQGNQPGEVNKDFYYGFNSQINQNLRGEMQPRVVMRVRSQARGFWRVLAFDRYTGQGWQISRNEEDQIRTLRRPSWSFRFLLPQQPSLNRTREIIQTYTVVSDLPNLVPVLYEPKELYFPTNKVAIDQEGGLRSPVPLSEGLTYTVVSNVPYRDRTQLQLVPAQVPEAAKKYAEPYLQIPEAIQSRIRQKTEEILTDAPNPLDSISEKTLYLAQYVKQNYKIQLDLPFFDAQEDLVEAFLFKYQGGYLDHFSTVLTVMLRSIGIPARLVMGFAPGEFNPFTGFYVVKNTDAYAMTEVYFQQFGWFTFDPIPGHELIPPSIEESQMFSTLERFWSWVAGWLPSPMTGFLNRVFEAIGFVLGWLMSLFTRGWLGFFIGIGLLTGLGFLGWLGWSGWRSWRYRRWLSHLPPMEAIYQQMLRWLEQQGFRKPQFQTPLEYAAQCREHHPPERAEAIDAISHAYVRWRYGRYSPDLLELKQRLRDLQKNR